MRQDTSRQEDADLGGRRNSGALRVDASSVPFLKRRPSGCAPVAMLHGEAAACARYCHAFLLPARRFLLPCLVYLAAKIVLIEKLSLGEGLRSAEAAELRDGR